MDMMDGLIASFFRAESVPILFLFGGPNWRSHSGIGVHSISMQHCTDHWN